MPLFTFDEEHLVAGVAAIDIDPEDPVAYHPISDHVSSGIPITRRPSSMYRRLSIRSSAPRSGSISIPADFGHDSLNAVKRLLCDFEPIRVLGQGAYGKVHLVKDLLNGNLYAQKQIRKPQIDVHEHKGSEDDSDNWKNAHVRRTIAERQILSQISHHQNIVKLFYAFQDHDKFYLLLQYIPGGELFHHLTAANNTLGNVFLEEHVAFYSAEMALGLKHLHLLGIVYRDLKPENCLLDTSGHLVLTDFGLSKAIEEGESEVECRSIIGTPEYMAPEILKGETYDYPVDWWLLGCVIYDMMMGKPPFTGKSHKVIQDKIIKSKPHYPMYFSQDAKDILGKLLQKNPAKRIAVDSSWETFKEHRFFRKLDWEALIDQLATPPIIPVITDPALAENFSEEFTTMKISNYDLGPGQMASDTILGTPRMFKGFSYTASNSYIEKYKA